MWSLTFINEDDFRNHVKLTIEKYGEKLNSFDVKRFNKNTIDPVKLIPQDTVFEELASLAKNFDIVSDDLSMAMAIYMLGFHSYHGFSKYES